MGWEKGKGLGKNAQGINKPVEAFVRKGKGALGFYGSERVEPVAPSVKPSKTKEKVTETTQQKLGQWKKAPGVRLLLFFPSHFQPFGLGKEES